MFFYVRCCSIAISRPNHILFSNWLRSSRIRWFATASMSECGFSSPLVGLSGQSGDSSAETTFTVNYAHACILSWKFLYPDQCFLFRAEISDEFDLIRQNNVCTPISFVSSIEVPSHRLTRSSHGTHVDGHQTLSTMATCCGQIPPVRPVNRHAMFQRIYVILDVRCLFTYRLLNISIFFRELR